jgi:hypothetical protein
VWIIAVAVLLTNLTIGTMNQHFRLLVLGNLSSDIDRFSLGRNHFGSAFCPRRLDSPTIRMGHYMLIFTF